MTIATILAGLAALLASQAPASEDEFVEGLRRVRSQVAREQWVEGERALDELLRVNEGQPYVLLHLPEVRDLLESCAFWRDRPAPPVEKLVSGDLKYHSESGGNLKVAYSSKRVEDFNVETYGEKDAAYDVVVHPAVFAGPFTFEIRGKSYPRPNATTRVPMIFVFLDGEPAHYALFGCKPYTENRYDRNEPIWSAPARMIRLEGDEGLLLNERAESPVEVGKPFALKVRVEATTISAFYNNKLLVTASKRSDVWGRVGFLGVPEFDEIVLQGKANPSWLRGLQDRALVEAWTKFEEARGGEKLLPAWLHLTSHDAFEDGFDVTRADLPFELAADAESFVRGALTAEESADATKQVEQLAKLAPTLEPAHLRDFLQALLDFRLGRLQAALVACERACEVDATFRAAHVLRERLLVGLGRLDEAREHLGRLHRDRPEDGVSAARLALLDYLLGNFEDLDRTCRDAVANGRYSADLDMVRGLWTRARFGPQWRDPVEHRTEHYLIRSDLDRRTCIEAGEVLESSLARFVARFGHAPKATELQPVYLFGGEWGYQRYARDAFSSAPENTAGVYHTKLRQLLIWNLPDREQMLATIRHEGFHQYMHTWADDAPRWLGEGLAEYYESADFKRGPSREIQLNQVHLATLRDPNTKHVALDRFIRLEPADFMADARANYARSWALVHFLMNTTPKRRKLIDALLEGCAAKLAPAAAVDAAFAEVDLNELERDFRRYVDELGS